MVNEPVITHLGMTSEEGPVTAFVTESGAAFWAAERPPGSFPRYVWPVLSIELGPPLRGEVVPRRQALVPVGDAPSE